MSYTRYHTSINHGHRHHVDIPMNGFGQPLEPYLMPTATIAPTSVLRPRRMRRGFGQEPASELFDVVTRDGVTFKLSRPAQLAEITREDYGVTPTFGKKVTFAGVTVDAKDVAWASGAATAEKLNAWLGRMRAEGNAVIASDAEDVALPTIDGAPWRETDVEALLIVTRDIELVGKIAKGDPGAVVLFEPAGGWERPSTTKAILIGAAALTLVAIGLSVMYRKRRS